MIVQGRNPDKISSSISTDVDMHRFYIGRNDISDSEKNTFLSQSSSLTLSLQAAAERYLLGKLYKYSRVQVENT